MAPVAAQQAHGKTIDRSMYQVTTSVAALFIDLDGERWRSDFLPVRPPRTMEERAKDRLASKEGAPGWTQRGKVYPCDQ